ERNFKGVAEVVEQKRLKLTYDFDKEEPFTPEDLEGIEKRMRDIVKNDIRFSRSELAKKDALDLFRQRGEPYKEELIKELTDDTVSIYSHGDFVDLCKGPHISSAGRIKAFKLISTAGAYWRGDEKRKMLQRIYGTAFATREDMEVHLERLDEAKKRDHRKLGKDLDLFSVSDEIGAGLVLWHPDGAFVRYLIEEFWRREHLKNSYQLVYTPHVALLDLWKTSGHWDFYRENLFSPMDVEGRDFIVKPMNCPFHIQIYKSGLRSYRDLPIRFAELGTVYRFERSGVLHGLLRVRGFTQDDAHIFMQPDQLKDEIQGVLKFTLYILKSFGFNEFDVFLSTRPENYVGSLENWALAEAALKDGLEALGLSYAIDQGEGVFYGPKIDIKIKDILGRSWQCSTIQVDFNLPERFDITYRDANSNDVRPIMIHRALMGSLERFMGCLVEHYAGAFPVWIAPKQAIMLTVTDRVRSYAKEVLGRLKAEGFRIELDARNEKLGLKIREAQLQKIPYMLIIGDKEASERTLSVRSREKGDMGTHTLVEVIRVLDNENKPLGGDFT
ncbi:MAG: threonine--tRNA ligase, partial [Deltaproteobacteria bacterium]|nr:threonine--tRNA ligase [Deltaproteobacteria bacterium]